MRTKTMKTGTLMAVDKAGKTHIVSKWTIFQDASGHGDHAERWEPVSQAFRLDNGNYVHFLDDATILDMRTGRRLRVAHTEGSTSAWQRPDSDGSLIG